MKARLLGAALAVIAGIAASEAEAGYPFFGGSKYDGSEYLTLDGTNVYADRFQGWVSGQLQNTGGPDGNANYFVDGATYNDYFAFSLSGLSADVTAASLTVSAFGSSYHPGYLYRLGDATPFVGSLYDVHGPSPVLFDALGSGVLFGAFAISSYSNSLTFTLNREAVNAINTDIRDGDPYFALGGTVTGVPEPAAWTLMLVGLGFAGSVLRASRRPRQSGAPL